MKKIVNTVLAASLLAAVGSTAMAADNATESSVCDQVGQVDEKTGLVAGAVAGGSLGVVGGPVGVVGGAVLGGIGGVLGVNVTDEVCDFVE